MDEELGGRGRIASSAPAAPLIVQFSSAALADIERLREFLRIADPRASSAVAEAIVAGASSLADFPCRAPTLSQSMDRRLTIPFGRAAYLIDYRVDEARETVTILRVRHSREAR